MCFIYDFLEHKRLLVINTTGLPRMNAKADSATMVLTSGDSSLYSGSATLLVRGTILTVKSLWKPKLRPYWHAEYMYRDVKLVFHRQTEALWPRNSAALWRPWKAHSCQTCSDAWWTEDMMTIPQPPSPTQLAGKTVVLDTEVTTILLLY